MLIPVQDGRPCPCCGESACKCRFYGAGQMIFPDGTNKPGVFCSLHWQPVDINLVPKELLK